MATLFLDFYPCRNTLFLRISSSETALFLQNQGPKTTLFLRRLPVGGFEHLDDLVVGEGPTVHLDEPAHGLDGVGGHLV